MSFLANPVFDPSHASETAQQGATNVLSHLLSEATTTDYRRVVTTGIDRVAERIRRTDRPTSGITRDDLEPHVAGIDLEEPLGDPNAALTELEDVYLRDAVYFHHPRYLAHLNCPVAIPALLGEAVLSSINSSLDTWDQSVGGTLIERRLIEWTAERLGLGPAADGVFTSGGTQSNLQAMLIARDEAYHLAQKEHPEPMRLAEVLPRLRILTSHCSHFSVLKAATLLGLDSEAMIPIPTDQHRRMQTMALAVELERCRREGLIPMAVVATAGTTDFGSIDPLEEIADLCAEAGVWMHVDAAYGCGLMVSIRRRELLDGIERADSVTVDFHKSFFQPVSSSAVLVRDRATLRHVTYHADYLNPERQAEQVPNQVDKSLQTTRRFDALKLWLTLRIMGADAVGALFDSVVDRALDVWRFLEDDPRFEVLCPPRLSTLVFRYLPSPDASAALCDRVNLHAREVLFGSGEAVIAGTVVDGRHYLKFTLLNPKTTLTDIARVLDLIAGHATAYLAAPTTPDFTLPRTS